MSVPPLSDAVKQTCNALKQSATKQISEYEQRFASLKNLYSELLADLIRAGFSSSEAWRAAEEFFGKTSVRFAGVDGTMYSRPMFDMVIFFGGAYAATGTVTFSENTAPQVRYDKKTLQQSMGISSVVPMYINEIPEVDQAFFAQEQPGEVSPSKVLTDEGIISNATIANSIMTFSEYYLAFKLATDPKQETRIILLDRSLSVERASLLYDTSKMEFWTAKCSIFGCKVDNGAVDVIDLALARHLVCNDGLGLPPPRADYLRYAIVNLAKKRGKVTFEQIKAEFGVKDEKRARRIERALKNLVKKEILIEEEGVYKLSEKYTSSWERIKKLTVAIGDSIFSKSPREESAGAMRIVKDGKEQWLTTLDIAFLTLFTLHMLMEECWKRRILLIGVTKDTAARDFKRQLVPIMHQEGLLKTQLRLEALQDLPNTDRMILQSASIFNSEQIQPPWSLIEYDSAFRTMLPDRQKRKGYVLGAIKNKIGLEKAFLKTYVQLSQAKTDPMLRSNVLLVDRLAYPEYDYKPESVVQFCNELSDGTLEPLETMLFRDKDVPNRLHNLVMSILVAMAPANIPEAFGHNKALFIADKVAKWNYSQFKCVVDTTAAWILNNHKLRKFIFYMSTFRERRASIEQARRESH
ncbi:MAG: hypothetical protein QW674_04535 [Candidatus Bathyarchaeia archaeon]